MRLLISLDYELFFGVRTGTVRRCMIEPTEAVLHALRPFNARLVLFVDATYLMRLEEEMERHAILREDYDMIRRQLFRVVSEGHDVQLHIHPHWLDSSFGGEAWQISTRRYRLHDFSAEEQRCIVMRSKEILERITGNAVYAFRAGGWCLQPFGEIAPSLKNADIWLDSTVYEGGWSGDRGREHDFRGAPHKSHWRFASDPVKEDPQGAFVEVPISTFQASPLLFWKMLFVKKIYPDRYRAFGEGTWVSHGLYYYFQRLFGLTHSVVSLDGLKAGELGSAFRKWRQNRRSDVFHVMGHPKALTPYSLERLESFLKGVAPVESVTFRDFRGLAPVIDG